MIREIQNRDIGMNKDKMRKNLCINEIPASKRLTQNFYALKDEFRQFKKEEECKIKKKEDLKKYFEDTVKTDYLHGKYMNVRLFLLFLLILSILTNLTIYQYNMEETKEKRFSHMVLYFSSSANQLLIIVIWTISVYVKGILKRERLVLSKYAGVFSDYGLLKLFRVILTLTIHPIIFASSYTNVDESYFSTEKVFRMFNRPVKDILIVVSITISFAFSIKIGLERVKFGNNKSHRIAKFFSIEVNTVYILRSMMRKKPILLIALMYILSLLYFGIVLMITENGYYIATGDPNCTYLNYPDVFWLVITTMTTVGYGQIHIGDPISRCIIILAGFFGILLTSLSVIAITNILQMSEYENKAFLMIKRLYYRKEKNDSANKLVGTLLRMGVSSLKGNIIDKLHYKKEVKKHFDDFNSVNEDFKKYSDTKFFHIKVKSYDIQFTIEDLEKFIKSREYNGGLANKRIEKRITIGETLRDSLIKLTNEYSHKD